MMHMLLAPAALVSAFFFPLPLTLLLSAFAAFFFPLFALFMGVLLDAIAYTPSVGVPLGTILGALVTLLTYLVRSFVKTRMMLPHA